MNDVADSNGHLKDSCTYSIETAKQFLTFGAGGLAFLVGLALSPDATNGMLVYSTFMLFTASIVLGLLYIMSVVGHISKQKNYDVYTPLLRWFSGLQILMVLSGVICLGFVVLSAMSRPRTSSRQTTLEITSAGRVVRYDVPQHAVVGVDISQSGDVHLRIEPAK